MKQQKIVWVANKNENTDFDVDYIKSYVLKSIDSKIIYDSSMVENCDNGIIIINYNKKRQDSEIEKYLSKSRNFILIHLSSESLPNPFWMYKYAKLIIRTYYDPRYYRSNIYSIPLGYKSGIGHTNYDIEQRCDNYGKKYKWFFAGQIKSDREKMLKEFSRIEPYYTHLIEKWNSDKSLTAEEIKYFLRDSYFVPCPMGWINPDSYRIMETLENNSIPVSKKFYGFDYLKCIYGDHPLIVEKTWKKCAERVEDLIMNEYELENHALNTSKWYNKFKSDLSQDLESILSGKQTKLISEQFRYQAYYACSRRIKLLYNYHFDIKAKIFI
jgi:hypothetical protein